MSRRTVLTHSVLAGLTPLIPVPVVDDLARNHVLRGLVRALAAARQQTLAPEDVTALADEGEKGCLTGCLVVAIVYPLKKLFRKIFYFLEWKRAADTASRTYLFGTLLDHALEQRWCAPAGPHAATAIRAAIEEAMREVGTGALETAIAEAFRRSKRTLRDGAALLTKAARRLSPRASAGEVGAAIEPGLDEEKRRIEGALGEVQAAIDGIPREYFERARARFAAALAPPPDQSSRR